MTKSEELQQYWRQYQEEHGYEPSGTRVVVDWAVSKGYLAPPKVDPLDILADRMARALREETTVDEHGREYRVNHSRRITKNGNQITIWAMMDHASLEHMEMAFTQRREQIVGDCLHLRNDVDVYNGKHPENRQYDLDLNFTEDVEERLAFVHEKVA